MKKNICLTATAVSFAAALALSACGGGGGGGGSSGSSSGTSSSNNGSSSTPPASTATSANVTTPQYAADSAQLAVFNTLNQQRQQCGFPAFVENTQLDQGSQSHASYMGHNGGLITDTEVTANPGFTGATYADRAVHFGFPQNVGVGGGSGGYYTNATLTETEYGQQIAYDFLSGVYHIGLAVWPSTEIGVGWNELTYNGFPEIQAAVSVSNFKPLSGSLPLTFPCQGTTGVAYSSLGETPTPPNTSGAWGTPVAVAGNVTDTIKLQSATMIDTSSNVITLQVMDSSNDPNHDIPAYEGVAYPKSPLAPNSTYSVSINGTINGAPFSRNFSFTTGNIIG
jgi:hypothetical protein